MTNHNKILSYCMVLALLGCSGFITTYERSSDQHIPATAPSEEVIAEMWIKFFGPIKNPGCGLLSWPYCVDKTCACYESKPEFAPLCSALKQTRNETDSQVIQQIIQKIVSQAGACPTKIREIFGSVLQLESNFCIKKLNERRAVLLLLEFMNPVAAGNHLEWKKFAPTITELLNGKSEYAELCKTINSIKDSKSAITIGTQLKKYLYLFPKEIDTMVNHLGMRGLLDLFNKRTRPV